MNTTNIFNSQYIDNYTTKKLRLPLDLEIINFNDPVHTFDVVVKGCNLRPYLISDSNTPRGCIGYNPMTMLKVILFAFQMKGYSSTREIADLCKNDIRFMWLLNDEKSTPSHIHMTISNSMNHHLKNNIKNIFKEITNYIFNPNNVNTSITFMGMEKFKLINGHYPTYLVLMQGMGIIIIIYIELSGMEKYQKFPTYKKETHDESFRDDIYRSANFKCNEENEFVCPNNRKYI